MENFIKNNRKSLVNISIILSVIVFCYIFFNYIFEYIAPFVIGWILSLIYNPLVNLLEKKFHIKRWLGSLITILILIGFFSSVVAGIITKLVSEAQLFIKRLPEYIEIIKSMGQTIITEIDKFIENLPFADFINIDIGNMNFTDIATPLIKTGGTGGFIVVKAIPGFFMVTLMALISSYFFSKDRYEIKKFLKNHIPMPKDNHIMIVKENLMNSLGGYFKTQLILMCYTFTICIIGLLIIGSPYALLLSVIISIIDALPFFGSGFILWPGTLIYIMSGEYFLAVGYIIIYLIINLMRQIMQPKILGTQIGVHPLIALISMYIGLKIIGVLGMIIGPIIAVVVKAFIEASEICENKKDT